MKYLVLACLFLCSCTAKKQATTIKTPDTKQEPTTQPTGTKPTEVNNTTPSMSADKIIFLNYKATKKSAETFEVELINKIIADGKLKKKPLSNKPPEVGDIYCIQLNDQSEPIESLLISNPLYKVVEYVDGDGQLNKKQVELEQAEFSIRMQLNPNTAFIIIEKIDNPNQELINSKL